METENDKQKFSASTRSKLGLVLGIAGIATLTTAIVVVALSAFGRIEWTQALTLVYWCAAAAALALLLIVVFALVRRRRGRPFFQLWPVLGAASAVVVVAYAVDWVAAWVEHPAIHDVSTDLADPPTFAVLPLRADNLDAVPGSDRRSMANLNPRQRWAAIHQDEYPGIRSVRIDDGAADVLEKAGRLARDRGWDIEENSPQGRLEARGTATLLAMPFIVVVEARPSGDGTASLIDMRMIAETGRSDHGVLAEEVESFLADLSGTTTAVRQ